MLSGTGEACEGDEMEVGGEGGQPGWSGELPEALSSE